MFYKCLPLTDPRNQFTYCPSIGASILFSILFGFTMLGHVWQAIQLRAGYSWVLIMSAIWQTLAFIIRCISIVNPTDQTVNNVTYVLVLLAPLWTNAFCYMVMARLVHMFMPNHRVFRIKGSWMAAIFVLLDIAAFLVQLFGALDAINKDPKIANHGLHLYTGGVALQQAFICGFIVITVTFLHRLPTRSTKENTTGAKKLTNLLLIVLGLITFRIVYRIIEFSGGFGNHITREIAQHEVYQYCFDTTPMFFAIIAFHVLHPGQVLQGPDSTFPTRKEKKAMKAEEKRLRETGSSSTGVVLGAGGRMAHNAEAGRDGPVIHG